jgi:hypothetical protein
MLLFDFLCLEVTNTQFVKKPNDSESFGLKVFMV